MARQPFLTTRLQGFGTTIFAEMSALAVETGSINLGQGFPDTDGPAEIVEAAVKAMREGQNQYPPGPGIPALRHAISAHQKRFWNLDYDPDTEVLVTAGATEALASAILALCEVGDEVIAFEPYYDSYAACISLGGAVRRPVTLRAPDFAVDLDELTAAVTPKTRCILLNTPHNPTGKVFTRAELEFIARLAIENDLVVICDEVYEHLVFDDAEHVPLATLPGMRDRTITISSGGKSFSFTGWKIGWICATPALVTAARTVKQFLTYVSGTPFQHAIAAALELPDAYYRGIAAELQVKRDLLAKGLHEAGFTVYQPRGTYFIVTDIRSLGETDGLAFCRKLPERAGVVAIPCSVFYDDKKEGNPLVRFAFPKKREVLEEAAERLARMR